MLKYKAIFVPVMLNKLKKICSYRQNLRICEKNTKKILSSVCIHPICNLCPLPPKENILPIRITAGEKKPRSISVIIESPGEAVNIC